MQPSASSPAARDHRELYWQVPLLLAISIAYENLFLHYGINRIDESWPLYAAMRMHDGGVLYDDVAWVFPPAHVITSWIAYWLDPPGFVLARTIFAGFTVALCVGLLFLGRRIMSPSFAFLGAVLVAVAAPRSHVFQVLFGYRYLVIPVLTLLAFSRRLSTGDARWMFVGGVAAGVALAFRLTPAFAVSCAVGIAVVSADSDWRRWFRDWTWFAAGLLIVALPILAWFASTVGLPKFWHEVVVHPLGMLQPLSPPEIEALDWSHRASIYRWFVAVQFRAHWFFYGGYLLALVYSWARARARGKAFDHSLLLAIAVFGGIYFIRSLGRSDESHLDSAIPPVCILFAHSLSVGYWALWSRVTAPRNLRIAVETGLCVAAVSLWIFLLGTDTYLDVARRGTHVIRAAEQLGEDIKITSSGKAEQMDRVVRMIVRRTQPTDQILNMSPTPIFHVFTGRTGPGYFDIMMPGTFLSEEEENGFLERMKASPPAAVIWPAHPFDHLPERSVESVAPRLSAWVQANYRITREKQHRWIVMFPIEKRIEKTTENTNEKTDEKSESGGASAPRP